ncbi:branched-chain amino acid ABC transporter permease [Halobacterium noricense]|uniref:branched-chain amino acid ABC transporter permease n=1 Tax=Halobacterium noricense TaxID=223182 RepID=UPI001E2E7F3A|nr:branched-chain amino acid ABC transporter permease [Halobacterium noricense]UHH26808.1 branched-chain amino acid ABC transporter permease [Halobacterium noricense]
MSDTDSKTTRDRFRLLLDQANNRVVAGGLIVVLLLLPAALNAFWTRIAVGALMWIGLAQSWNMIGGYAGYLDFGHGAYFGIGAFAAGITMTTYGLPFIAGLSVAAIVCAIVALGVGIPTLRLKGAYFAIATWAFAESMHELALILDITGGTFGMSLPTGADAIILPLSGPPTEMFFYYVMLALAVGTTVLAYVLFERSEFGFRVKAIRDNEDAAQTLGINAERIKRQVYVLSCSIAGLFGAANAFYITFIHPNDVLASILTDQMIIMALLGGLGTIAGPIVGGISIFMLDRMSSLFLGTSTLYLPMIGLLIMLTVLFAPSGIIGILRGEVGLTEIKDNVSELADKFNFTR